MRRHVIVAFPLASILLLTAWLLTIRAEAPDIYVGAFSAYGQEGRLPPGWRPWILKNVKRHSTYSEVADDGGAVEALADHSASGLMRRVAIDPFSYPIMEWRWKVAGILEGADISKREKNDAPARIYVAFAYDMGKIGLLERMKYRIAKGVYSQFLPLRALSYTWANKTQKGSIVPMPYTGWFKQIVVENGASPVNAWITEERDVYADYRKAFGEDPAEITGVAIMTNTDNMGGQAAAWYGDIVFKQRRKGER